MSLTLPAFRPRPFALAALACALAVTPAAARREAAPSAARAALDPATAAARAWATDAVLVYLENDEPFAADGAAPRWSSLWYSPSLEASRVYSVREERVVVAEAFDLKFAAPALGSEWLDSREAVAAARDHAEGALRAAKEPVLTHMLLGRGAFQPGQADLTTWTLVFETADGPSVFVVVDAANGRVCRTWRG